MLRRIDGPHTAREHSQRANMQYNAVGSKPVRPIAQRRCTATLIRGASLFF